MIDPIQPGGIPPTPPQALTPTDAGARAFAEHYFVMETLSYARMDGMLLNPLSAAECSPCYRTFHAIDGERALGNRLVGYWRTFTAESVKRYPAEPGAVSVIGRLVAGHPERVDRSGTVLNAFDVPSGRAAVSLMWQRGQWKVTTLQLLGR